VEAHGQDLLLELTAELTFTGRFHYRDFEGLQVDWELRRALNRPRSGNLPNSWSWHETYGGWEDDRYASSIWYKWRLSLLLYLQVVLHETEMSLREWQRQGLIGGSACREDEVTMMFSHSMFAAIEQMFGMHCGPAFNIFRSLNRFLTLLARVRRAVIETGPVRIG
jgi:hypothetical protein